LMYSLSWQKYFRELMPFCHTFFFSSERHLLTMSSLID
jgi:hypothetical protein